MEGHPAFLLLGLAAGLASGLFGLGGGVIVVPALVAFGATAVDAVGTSVFVVLINASVGTVAHTRLRNVSFRRALLMIPGAIVLAPVGSVLADRLPEVVLCGSFSLMLITMGWLVLRGKTQVTTREDERVRWWGGPLVGGLGGLLGGLFGIGGGAVLVPLQILLLRASARSAIGTSLLVMIASMLAALATHAAAAQIHWLAGAWIAVGGVVGAPLGAQLAQRLTERQLRAGFTVTLVLLAATMIYETVRLAAGL